MTVDPARRTPAPPAVDARRALAHNRTEVVDAFRRGEHWAAQRLIDEATPQVTALVRRLLAWPEDVEDVVQDVFVAAFVARNRFRGESRFDTWITRIAINRCRAHNRRRWVRQKLLSAWWEASARREPADEGESTPKDDADMVRQAVAELPHAYREVVALFYLEELPAREVARILGIRTNTVEKRLSRAREKLARRLSPPAQ